MLESDSNMTLKIGVKLSKLKTWTRTLSRLRGRTSKIGNNFELN